MVLPNQVVVILTIFSPVGGAPEEGVSSCLAMASLWVRLLALSTVRDPSSLMTMEAPG